MRNIHVFCSSMLCSHLDPPYSLWELFMEGRDLIQLQHPKPTDAQSGFLQVTGLRFCLEISGNNSGSFFLLITLNKKVTFMWF